jgi:hypothetical protein
MIPIDLRESENAISDIGTSERASKRPVVCGKKKKKPQ